MGQYANVGVGCVSCPPFTTSTVVGALACIPVCPVPSTLTVSYVRCTPVWQLDGRSAVEVAKLFSLSDSVGGQSAPWEEPMLCFCSSCVAMPACLLHDAYISQIHPAHDHNRKPGGDGGVCDPGDGCYSEQQRHTVSHWSWLTGVLSLKRWPWLSLESDVMLRPVASCRVLSHASC